MRRKSNIKAFIMTLLCSLAGGLSAQSQYDVTVNSAFSPTISDAQRKIDKKANIVDTVHIMPKINHSVTPLVYQSDFKPEPINAPKVGKDKIVRLYRNFLKVGFGNYWTPYLDFEVGSLRSTRGAFGVRVFHHSSWGKIKDYATASFSDTKAEIYGQKFFNKYTLTAKAGYNHLMLHNYGIKIDSTNEFYNNSDYSRRHNHIASAHLDFASNREQNVQKLNQYYGLDYQYFAGNDRGYTGVPITEHTLSFLTDLNHDINFKRAGYLNIGGKIGFDMIHGTEVMNWRSYLISASPSISYIYGEYFIKAGLKTVFDIKGEKLFHIYPDVEVKLTLVPNIFTLYAGVDGGLIPLSFRELFKENPYLGYGGACIVNEKFKVYLGLQTGISRSLSMGAKASYAMVDNMPFFVNIKESIFIDTVVLPILNRFTVAPINRTQHFNVHFNLDYTYKNQLKLGLNLDYNYYILNEHPDYLVPNDYLPYLQRAWYKPAFVAQFTGQYLLLKKFLFSLDAYVNFGVPYPEFTANGGITPKTLKPFLDFDFGFEYLWSNRFSIFANINNFAFQRNFYYFDYPSYRINALAGVKWTFGGEKIGKK